MRYHKILNIKPKVTFVQSVFLFTYTPFWGVFFSFFSFGGG